jgi:hypothetical protein
MNRSDHPDAAAAPEFFARLGQYPQLCGQIAALLDEMENRAGTFNTADEAEDAVVERIRALGRLTLTLWAEQRQAAVQPERTPGLRQGGKKKSAG